MLYFQTKEAISFLQHDATSLDALLVRYIANSWNLCFIILQTENATPRLQQDNSNLIF